jgi:hypothetical protein
MSNVITIDDGLKTYDIVNKSGKLLGQFSFNPSDTNIIRRHAEVISSLEKISENIPEDVEEENGTEALKKIEEIIYEKVDYLLNADVAREFFAIMGPMTLLENGQFFVENVIDAIGQAISAETGARVKKLNTKVRKHTSKYHG